MNIEFKLVDLKFLPTISKCSFVALIFVCLFISESVAQDDIDSTRQYIIQGGIVSIGSSDRVSSTLAIRTKKQKNKTRSTGYTLYYNYLSNKEDVQFQTIAIGGIIDTIYFGGPRDIQELGVSYDLWRSVFKRGLIDLGFFSSYGYEYRRSTIDQNPRGNKIDSNSHSLQINFNPYITVKIVNRLSLIANVNLVELNYGYERSMNLDTDFTSSFATGDLNLIPDVRFGLLFGF